LDWALSPVRQEVSIPAEQLRSLHFGQQLDPFENQTLSPHRCQKKNSKCQTDCPGQFSHQLVSVQFYFIKNELRLVSMQ
jgi:hypothetical protein